MSCIIDQFVTLQTSEHQNKSQQQYESVWPKIQNKIDKFDEYRIKRALHHQIEQNEDLVKELLHLMQIWKETLTFKTDPQLVHDKGNEVDRCFFEMPERQLLQNQILLNLKEIKRNALTKNISIHLLLSFDTKSMEYKTLMYLIKAPRDRSNKARKTSTNYSQKRPQTSFTINPRKMLKNDMDISLTNDDIIEQTRCALKDEYCILLHRIHQLTIKLDDVCKEKLRVTNNKAIKETFIPSTIQMQKLNDKLQQICNSFAHNTTKHKHIRNKIKLKPLKRPQRRLRSAII
eukprot:99661_1